MRFAIAGILAVLGATAASEAAVIFQLVDKGVPVTAQGTMTGWKGYVVQAVSDNGKITAVDFSGAKAFTGSMGQRWGSSEADGVTFDTKSPGFLTNVNTGTSSFNADSHFLGDPANFTVGNALNETASFPNGNPLPSQLAFGYGVGTSLSGAYGIAGAAQATTLDVAYIVVKDGTQVTYTNAQIATAGGTFLVSGIVGVPEPTSLAVLGLGAIGMLRRRRMA